MLQSKYELRSNEVQEVMNKPPHYLIRWSNTIILTIIIGGIWLLGSIEFPNKITIPFQVSEKDTIMVLNISHLPKEIKSKQVISLSFESYPVASYGSIHSTIDTVLNIQERSIISVHNLSPSMFSDNGKRIILNDKQLGVAEIIVGKKSVFDMFKSKCSI